MIWIKLRRNGVRRGYLVKARSWKHLQQCARYHLKDLTAQVVFRNESHQRIGKDVRFSDYADKNVWACLPNEGRGVRSIPEQSEESWIEAPPRVISQTKGSPTEHPRLPIEVLVMTIEKFINGLMKKKKHE